jgi:nucleoside-diphosphate-sugar epimerase
MSDNTPILVIGAAGNVGSVGRGIVKLLRERDLQVRALVHRLDERSQVLSEMGAELVVADLTNGADVVINYALTQALDHDDCEKNTNKKREV